MSSKEDNLDLPPLEPSMMLARSIKYTDDFESAMKREWGPKDRNVLIMLGIGLPVFLVGVITGISWLMMASVVGIGLTSMGLLTKDWIKEDKNVKKMMEGPKKTDIQYAEPEPSVDEVQSKEWSLEGDGENYYKADTHSDTPLTTKDPSNDKYQRAVQQSLAMHDKHIEIVGKTRNDRKEAALKASKTQRDKYIFTLAKQRVLAERARENKVVSITGESVQPSEDDNSNLNKDETGKKIINDTSIYKRIYQKLPPIDISDKEWNIFYNHVYSLFCRRRFQKSFYEVMAYINRFVLADALIRHKSRINISDYVGGIRLLASNSWENGFSNEEVQELLKLLKESLPKADIVKFPTGGKKKHR